MTVPPVFRLSLNNVNFPSGEYSTEPSGGKKQTVQVAEFHHVNLNSVFQMHFVAF